ncbi:MAG: hypothetical protein HYS27_05780 [Deltaproteobacteria bacterium]|nr:hypothetical protein [Deltaproteobacteria bacterium]
MSGAAQPLAGRPTRTAVALAVALGASACGQTPTQGFEEFYGALVDGDAHALDLLDGASRRQVEQAASAQGIAPVRVLAGDGVRSTLRAIRERERAGERATLEVEDALGAKEAVTMVREQGRWKVALAGAAEAPEVAR